MLAQKLQHEITQRLEKGVYFDLFNASSRYHQTILTSISRNVATSGYLTHLPTEPAYRIGDDSLRLAIRSRLGMLPYDHLRDEQCEGCKRSLLATPAFADNPDHFHSCGHTAGRSVTQRHDQLKHALAKLARSVGFVVIVEPKFPATFTHHIDAATGHSSLTALKTDERGDLLLIRHDKKLLVDIRVCRPTCLSELQRSDKGNREPLITAAAHEKLKHRKYDKECQKHGWTFVPFVLETYGGMGKEAQKLLTVLADACDTLPSLAFLTHARAVLSVTLQCGHAAVSQQGMTSWSTRQHARER